MPKIKKSPIFQYGIEITKPHSNEMYSHNDMIAKQMRFNITDAWANEMIKFNKTDEWPSSEDVHLKMHTIQSAICATGYGEGFTIDEVHIDFMSNLSNMANWQLHEEYSYLCFKGLVSRTRFMMLGFELQEWPSGTTVDYSFCTDIDLSPIAVMEEQTKNL